MEIRSPRFMSAKRACLLPLVWLLSPLVLRAQAAPPGGFTPPPPHVNAPLGEIKRLPGDGAGAFKTGKYRDLFAEQGHSQAEIKTRLDKAFQRLFHGDGA